MENGSGHRGSGEEPPETSSGLAAQVVGRQPFKSMLGGNILSPRRTRFWTDMVDIWGCQDSEQDLAEIKERLTHTIIFRRGAIEINEFKEICEGVLEHGVNKDLVEDHSGSMTKDKKWTPDLMRN
ncbi:MAG: hypothetical protein M1132_06095 [Chloroflexi bacterium]|nr:hypothetical protein [Chloroflexota bacterium]